MRKLVFLSVSEALKGLQVIKTFGMWNQQIAFAEEEVFDTPAIFIEFGNMPWRSLGGGVMQTDSSFKLHIVTEYKGSEEDGSLQQADALNRFDILESIDAALLNLSGGNATSNQFINVLPSTSSTNHDHGELVEDIEEFTFRGYMRLKQ